MPRFSDLARPLNALTRKDVSFEWTPICQESFKLLKTSLMTEPILTYPDPNFPYLLFTDASKYAWACVLMQEKTHQIEEKEDFTSNNLYEWSFSWKSNELGLFN